MMLHLAEMPLAGGLFNIGSGQAATWLELGQAIFAALGRPSQIDFVDMPDHLRGKYQYFTQADMSRFPSNKLSGNSHTTTRFCSRLRPELPHGEQAPRR